MRGMFKIKIYYLLLLPLAFSACSKSTDEAENATAIPVLTSFVPTSGSAGSIVVLSGTNFSTTIESNAVSIDGIEALVTAASSTQLTVTVPTGASSGKIVIITNGSAITSATPFTIAQH